jgi:hypothetical protein
MVVLLLNYLLKLHKTTHMKKAISLLALVLFFTFSAYAQDAKPMPEHTPILQPSWVQQVPPVTVNNNIYPPAREPRVIYRDRKRNTQPKQDAEAKQNNEPSKKDLQPQEAPLLSNTGVLVWLFVLSLVVMGLLVSLLFLIGRNRCNPHACYSHGYYPHGMPPLVQTIRHEGTVTHNGKVDTSGTLAGTINHTGVVKIPSTVVAQGQAQPTQTATVPEVRQNGGDVTQG